MRWAINVPAGPADATAFRGRAEAAVAEYVQRRTATIAPPHGGWSNAAMGTGPAPEPDGWTPEDEQQVRAAIDGAVALLPVIGVGRSDWARAMLRGESVEHAPEDYDQQHIVVEVYRTVVGFGVAGG